MIYHKQPIKFLVFVVGKRDKIFLFFGNLTLDTRTSGCSYGENKKQDTKTSSKMFGPIFS